MRRSPRDSNEWISVPAESLVDNSVTDFNLYVLGSDEAILYANANYLWERDELERLVNSGYQELSTEETNRQKVAIYNEVHQISLADNLLPPSERIHQIESIGSLFTQSLFRGEVTEACIHRGKRISDSLAECILEQITCVSALQDLVNHDQYVFHHSVRVAMYATAIAITLGMRDEGALKEIAFGSIFHDIGKSRIPSKIINKAGVLTEEERKVMRSHPEIGYSFLEKTVVSQVPKEIILHHHERIDGGGYPHGLTKNRLLTEVSIVTLADIFDALTSVRSYQKSRSKFEALELIKSKLMGQHVTPEIYCALVSCLAGTD